MSEETKPRSRLLDPWVIGAFVAMVALTLSRPCFVREPPPPEAGALLPAFALRDQHDKPFGSAELAGRVWVAALLPAEPGAHAQRALEGILRLQEEWKVKAPDLLLVLVAVEPERLGPDELRIFGVEHGADFARLKFLTGDHESTCLAVAGFIEDARVSSCERLVELAERGRLLLVDAEGRSRGLYRADLLGLEEVHFRALAVAQAR